MEIRVDALGQRPAGAEFEGLRRFGHGPARFEEFRCRYTDELAAQEEKLRELRSRARGGTLTLVYGARDTGINDAVVSAEILLRGRRSR